MSLEQKNARSLFLFVADFSILPNPQDYVAEVSALYRVPEGELEKAQHRGGLIQQATELLSETYPAPQYQILPEEARDIFELEARRPGIRGFRQIPVELNLEALARAQILAA